MGINLIAPGASFSTATLIADSVAIPGASKDGTARLTKNGGNPVSAALELQSVLGGLLLPRMTAAQMNALNAVNGFMVYTSDTNTFSFYQNGAWTPIGGIVSATVNLNQAAIQGMNAAAVAILPAPGAGNVIIVNRLLLDYTYANATAYNTGGVIALQYGAGAYSAGNAASGTIAATAVTAAANNIATASGSTNIASASAINTGVFLSNATAAFAAGGAASNLAVRVWYSIVAAV